LFRISSFEFDSNFEFQISNFPPFAFHPQLGHDFPMILDCHVHVSATTKGHGLMSETLLRGVLFTLMRWKFGLEGHGEADERKIEHLLARTINQTKLDAAVVLAFDAVYDRDGNTDWKNTHLYVTNDYVIELAARHPKMLLGASIHPYRKDAVAELERCAVAGAVLVKWLPITQNFNPADPRCIPFYEALAHLNIPLLSHTGWEHALPSLDPLTADPMLLLEALRRGVKVIAAHCGTRAFPWEIDYLPNWIRLAREHEHFYGDTAALNVPGRWYAYDTLLDDPVLRSKLIHGSDWPIAAVPPVGKLGWESLEMLKDDNSLRRDIGIKERLGLDDDYWQRAGKILRVSPVLNQKAK
jgi:predicted TIM-barrel fold metal-dependent hydrolase